MDHPLSNSSVSAPLKLSLATLVGSGLVFLATTAQAQTLPPVEEIPEEVLRTEVITSARSPLDGTPLSAAEYAQLQANLRSPDRVQAQLASELPGGIMQLRLLKVLKGLLPFLPL